MLQNLIIESQNLITMTSGNMLNTIAGPALSPILRNMLIGSGFGLAARAVIDYGWHRFLLGEDPYNFDLRITTRLKSYASYAVYGAALGALVEPIRFLGEAAIQALYSRY